MPFLLCCSPMSGVETDVAMARIHIVVADDEPGIRALVTDILEEAGYTVEVFGDGLSALAAIYANPPAVALFDVAMPVMTGDEALQQLRADGVPVPVIVMTAGTNPQRFLQLGAAAVLPKPFELTELLAVIDAVCAPPIKLQEVALADTHTRRPHAPR